MQNLFSRLSSGVSESEQLDIIMTNMSPFFISRLALSEVSSIRELKDVCARLELAKNKCEFRGFLNPGDTSIIPDVCKVNNRPSASAVGNNNKLCLLGIVCLPIAYAGKVEMIDFYVCEDINAPIILGVDFLRKFDLCQDIFADVGNMVCHESMNLIKDNEIHLHEVGDLTEDQRVELELVVDRFRELAATDSKLGFTTLEEHVIDTGDSSPIKQKFYPIPFHHRDYVRREIENMERLGIVEKSNSPWNSPILLVPKANGELRLCLDSRKLNSVTKIDSYPMPRVEEILDSLNNAKFISSLDLKSAFFQIGLEQSSREKTCFSVSGLGSWQFCRMPFGLVNATARMMRLMDKVFGPEFSGSVFYYVDDVILISDSFSNHIKLLHEVVEKLKNAGRLARWAIRLSQYNFIVEHRKAAEQAAPDALSRAPASDELFKFQASVLALEGDSWYSGMFKKVSAAPGKFPDWRVIEERLYKRVRNSNPLAVDCEWKLVVPESLRNEVLKQCHDRPEAAHLGVFKTFKRLSQSYFWPKMINDVKRYVKRCQVCLAHKSVNVPPPGLMENPKKVQRPFQVLSTDIIGPLPRSYSGYKFILVVSDYFTKYTQLFPMRSSLAKSVVSIIENQFLMRHGIPQCIIMDNGPQYISNHMKMLKAKYKIPNLFYNCRFLPQNNPAERVNRVVVTALASLVGTDQRHWSDNIHKIEFAMNTAVHEVTGYSPFLLTFGREAVLSGDWYPDRELSVEELQFVDRDLYASMLLHLKPLFENFNAAIKKSYHRSRTYYNKNRTQVEYEVGQVVWKREYPLSDADKFFAKKLAPKFKKCVVQRKVSPVSYELQDFHSGKSLGRWHIKDIVKSEPDN
ncbi:unnamed protein product [Arctia plantaginis]|uniref:RNA-directed DNA polymerase n=2 Tax=Arctia plantaginis TaxID=874455 RepID=A0A8S1B3Q9_ARCPL|nr:unnamed protein product [Arctia plantaginis]